MPILNEQMYEANEEELIVLSYLTAKVQTLQARCHLESGLFAEAKRKLNEAMSNLGYYFPRHKFAIDVNSAIQFELLRCRLACPKNWKIETIDEYSINYIEQLSNCLAQMFNVFRVSILSFCQHFFFIHLSESEQLRRTYSS